VAIVANGEIVHARAERIGSEDINASIVDHVRRHRGLVVGPQSAERLKLELASATLPVDLAREVTIKGLDVLTRSPGAIEITAGELYPVVLSFLLRLAGTSTNGESSLRVAVPNLAALKIFFGSKPNCQCASLMNPSMPLCGVLSRCLTSHSGYVGSYVGNLIRCSIWRVD
jgi:hypothetical protein